MKIANSQFAFFGYGSLVNRATHQSEIIGFSRATLKGWRRHWLPRPRGPYGHVALLSVYLDHASEIDGLLAIDHVHNLPDLDEREIRYDRLTVNHENLAHHGSFNHSFDQITLYKAKQIDPVIDADRCRILRSYLDAVMQGYLNKFGIEGLNRFIVTTDNFEIGIREDRKKPVYSRPVSLSTKEQSLFDQLAPPSEIRPASVSPPRPDRTNITTP